MSHSATTRQQSNDARRRVLNPGDVGVGCILWLPLKEDANDPVFCTKKTCLREELDKGGYNHPVVVLSFRQRENSSRRGDLVCTVGLLTTFTNTSLAKYEKKRSRNPHFKNSLPIYQPATDDESGPVNPNPNPNSGYLYLESLRMKKQGFVRYDHIFEIPVGYLRTYGTRRRSRACQYRLNQLSYTMLMKESGLPAEPYIETHKLAETADARIALLARPQAQVAIPAQSSSSHQAPTTPVPHTSMPSREQTYYDAVRQTSTSASQPNYQHFQSPVRQPLTRPVRPNHQRQRLPVYEYGYSRFGQEENHPDWESEGWTATILLCVGVLASIGFLVGWYSG